MAVDLDHSTAADLESAAGAGDPVRAGGDTVGRAEAVYYDRATGAPRWLAIRTDSGRLIAPAAGARPAGGAVELPYSAAKVRTAPRVTAETIPPATESELARHYGLLSESPTIARRPATPVARPAPQAWPSLWRETKPFFLTSEFLLTVLGIAGMFITSAVTEDSLWHQRAWTLATVLAAAYIASRGLAKAARREYADRRRRSGDAFETKPFWLTSEAFVLIVGLVAIFLTTWIDGDVLTRERAWLLATILGATYVVSRGIAKAGVAHFERDRRDSPLERDPY